MRRLFVFSTVLGMVFGLLSVTGMPAFGTHDPNVIHACVKKIGGAIRIVSSASKCIPFFEMAIELQKAGAPGSDTCPSDMVAVGPLCVDKHEASVWENPNGTGTQFGTDGNGDGDPDNDYPCLPNGNDCSATADNPIYALSLPNVIPSSFITWFQAQQACHNVGKRLLRNDEWQAAAAGTQNPELPPPPGAEDCNVAGPEEPVPTGSRSNCVSNWGAFDMVGNLFEWVGEWIQGNTDPWAPVFLGTAGADFGDDAIFGINPAIGQSPDTDFPAALIRGGWHGEGPGDGNGAGVFALAAGIAPSISSSNIGFRCARPR
ncbi:MAG: formylglycine-generating enzyme family protein [Anaerolineae bacterium]|nr:formylglycine-generating enzyme family protein [Anaerolineae bacterium]